MPVTVVSSLEQFQQIIKSGKVVAFDFWATWCGPCKMISPVFEKFSAEFEEIEFYKVDVDEQPDIAQEVGIRSMPTFIIFKDGQRIGDFIGASASGLKSLMDKAKDHVPKSA